MVCQAGCYGLKDEEMQPTSIQSLGSNGKSE
jgi:hypothetical protein